MSEAGLSPADLLAAADVFCLPTHREGFGSSVIEAAAVGLPAILSRIYGLEGAAVPGETALFHEVGRADEIADLLGRFLRDKALRVELGRKARDRVLEKFPGERLTQELLRLYAGLLREDSGSGPG